MGSLQRDEELDARFPCAYRVPRSRSFWSETAIAIGMVFMRSPLVGASALLVFGGQVENLVLDALKVDPVLNPWRGCGSSSHRPCAT